MRTMTPATLAALIAQDLQPVMLFEGVFPAGTVRLWTGLGDVVWNSQTWTGAGTLIGVSEIEETTDVVASGITVALSGVAPQSVALAITDAQQGLPGKIWIGLLDAAGAIIVDPVEVFAGRLDVPQVTDGTESCTITISYESRLIDLSRAREFRYTHESQQALFPGDKGFEYVAGLQQKEITWGQN